MEDRNKGGKGVMKRGAFTFHGSEDDFLKAVEKRSKITFKIVVPLSVPGANAILEVAIESFLRVGTRPVAAYVLTEQAKKERELKNDPLSVLMDDATYQLQEETHKKPKG